MSYSSVLLAAKASQRSQPAGNGSEKMAAPEARAAESRRHPHGSNQIQSEKGEAQTRKIKKRKRKPYPNGKKDVPAPPTRQVAVTPRSGSHVSRRTRGRCYATGIGGGGKPTSGAGQHPTCTITRRRGPGASINFTRALLGSRHLCAPLSPPRLPWPSSPRAPPGGRGNPVPILFLRARLRLGGGSKAPRAFWLRTPAISDSDSP
jgi:hypothetical protein